MILLVSLEDLFPRPAAEVLGVPVGTVMSRSRAAANGWRQAIPARIPVRRGGEVSGLTTASSKMTCTLTWTAWSAPDPAARSSPTAGSNRRAEQVAGHRGAVASVPVHRWPTVPAARPAQPDRRRYAERRIVYALLLLLAILVGGAGGWALGGIRTTPSDSTLLAQEAIANHVVDRRPPAPDRTGREQRDDPRQVGVQLPAAWPAARHGLGRVPLHGRTKLRRRRRSPGCSCTRTPTARADRVRAADARRVRHADPHGGCRENGRLRGSIKASAAVVAPVPSKELHDLAVEVRRQLEAPT